MRKGSEAPTPIPLGIYP